MIPGWGTKIPHATRCSQKKTKKNKEGKLRIIPGPPTEWAPEAEPGKTGAPGLQKCPSQLFYKEQEIWTGSAEDKWELLQKVDLLLSWGQDRWDRSWGSWF